jgi:hypothetical protein
LSTIDVDDTQFDRVYNIMMVLDPSRALEEPPTENALCTEWVHEDLENAEEYTNNPDLRGFVFTDPIPRDPDEIPLRPGFGEVWIHEKV